MVINFSGGKIILSPFEVNVRLNKNMTLFAMVDDLAFHQGALMLVADAGAVRWSIKLDDIEQFMQIKSELGIDS